MRKHRRLAFWIGLHKWSSLGCTLFLLVLCLTGLPLIFADELEALPGAAPSTAPDARRTTGEADPDAMLAQALAGHPGMLPASLAFDDEAATVSIGMIRSWEASLRQPESNRYLRFDLRTATMLPDASAQAQQREHAMGMIKRLHSDLFLFLPGELWLAAMAALFIVASVSGIVVYAPFMRKFGFGVIRRGKSARVAWLDIHNLAGIVAVVWALLMGATGAINETHGLLYRHWIDTEVRQAIAAAAATGDTRQPVRAGPSIRSILASVQRAMPGMKVKTLGFPRADDGRPRHFLAWAGGDTRLTAHLSTAVLVDARDGSLASILPMPWYLRVLELSRPLHFGDYGGLPLKVLWLLLDLVTITVLASGIYLWASRRSRAA